MHESQMTVDNCNEVRKIRHIHKTQPGTVELVSNKDEIAEYITNIIV